MVVGFIYPVRAQILAVAVRGNALGQIRVGCSDGGAVYLERTGVERQISIHARHEGGADIKHLAEKVGRGLGSRATVCDKRERRSVREDRLGRRIVGAANYIQLKCRNRPGRRCKQQRRGQNDCSDEPVARFTHVPTLILRS